jgi:hypothetical protein
MTSSGFQAMIFTPRGRVFVTRADPASDEPLYRSWYTADTESPAFQCGVDGHARDLGEWVKPDPAQASRVAGNLLQYDIAIAATLEYYTLLGDPGTTNEIAAALSAISAIYERDLGITLQLVAGNDMLYETVDSGLDNDDVSALLGQVDDWIDTNLPGGDGAYDIGHIFSRLPSGSAGIARLGAVCDSSFKASGVSGSSVPVGSTFYIDLVAHEIGHQFNAEHTFNGTAGACLTNRSEDSAVEPGSGSTIMAYAGICGAENLQSSSDATFHARSIAQIDAFTAAGGSCSALVPNGNADPTVGAIADKTIPALTPFMLDASVANDGDGDPLQFQWDQMDAGCATDSASFGTDIGSNALFRSHAPRDESWRHFPALGTQVTGRFDKAEVMACNDRNLDFLVTVRDGASGQATEDVRVSVDASSGPFRVTGPTAGPIFSGSAFTVTWDVAGTNQAPVNCAEVDIDLLAFSNSSYLRYSEHSLADNVANDGSQAVTFLPATAAHDPVRIRVKCSDNVFYDISDDDLQLVQNITPATSLDSDDLNTRFSANVSLTSTSAPACGAVVSCASGGGISVDDDDDGRRANGDASAADFRWLMLLAVLAGLAKLRRRYGLQ